MRVAVERERAELERVRADVLSERNRLAREVHDLLAHTLGALTVQLEALDATFADAAGVDESLRAGLRRTRSLAADGLADARRAVLALREGAAPLRAQFAELCELRGATLSVFGSPRELPTQVVLALYRVAQESLTNAAKHAPGAAVEARLGFESKEVSVAVENGAAAGPPGELARSGAGYGLEGIRERLRLVGGEFTAGPRGEGWAVRVRVPA